MDHFGSWSDLTLIVVQGTLRLRLGSVGSNQVIEGVTRSPQCMCGISLLWSSLCIHIFGE